MVIAQNNKLTDIHHKYKNQNEFQWIKHYTVPIFGEINTKVGKKESG